MKKVITTVLLFLTLSLLVSAANAKNIIKSHYNALKLYKKEKNASKAKEVMEEAGIKEILNGKLKGMSEAEYISALNDYGFFISETDNYFDSRNILEKVILLDNERMVAYLNLGDIYYKEFQKTKNTDYEAKMRENYSIYKSLFQKGTYKIEIPKRVSERLGIKNEEENKTITWGKYLNPGGNVPTNKYKAFYINTDEPKKIIATEVTDYVGIHYVFSDFKGIPSQDFGAYWVGNFDFDKDTNKQIVVGQSWSETRIVIDNNVVYRAGDTKGLTYNFKKGRHKIEVEFINNWHTTNLIVEFKDISRVYTRDEIKEKMKSIVDANTKVYYAGGYESSDSNNIIKLDIKNSDSPTVIFLSTFLNVRWNIINPNNAKIKAIVYSKGSSIKFDGEYKGELFQADISEYAYEERDMGPIEWLIKDTCGRDLDGFSMEYGAKNLSLPQTRKESKP